MRFGAALATCILYAAQTGAAQRGNLEVKNEVFREVVVTGADGTRALEFVPAGTVVPGNEIVYVTTVTNIGGKPAEQVVIDNPIPEHTTFQANSTFGAGAGVLVSVDGGKQWGDLGTLQVAGADGAPRHAEARDVTHLRFRLANPLAPRASGRFGFRALLR